MAPLFQRDRYSTTNTTLTITALGLFGENMAQALRHGTIKSDGL